MQTGNGELSVELFNEDKTEELRRRRKQARMEDIIDRESDGSLKHETEGDEKLAKERKEEIDTLTIEDRAKLQAVGFFFRKTRRKSLKKQIRKRNEKILEKEEKLRKQRMERNKAIFDRRNAETKKRLQLWMFDVGKIRNSLKAMNDAASSTEAGQNAEELEQIENILKNLNELLKLCDSSVLDAAEASKSKGEDITLAATESPETDTNDSSPKPVTTQAVIVPTAAPSGVQPQATSKTPSSPSGTTPLQSVQQSTTQAQETVKSPKTSKKPPELPKTQTDLEEIQVPFGQHKPGATDSDSKSVEQMPVTTDSDSKSVKQTPVTTDSDSKSVKQTPVTSDPDSESVKQTPVTSDPEEEQTKTPVPQAKTLKESDTMTVDKEVEESLPSPPGTSSAQVSDTPSQTSTSAAAQSPQVQPTGTPVPSGQPATSMSEVQKPADHTTQLPGAVPVPTGQTAPAAGAPAPDKEKEEKKTTLGDVQTHITSVIGSIDQVVGGEGNALEKKPKTKAYLEKIGKVMKTIEGKYVSVVTDAINKGEKINFATLFERAMTEKSADGFVPDYSGAGKDNEMNHILDLRYKNQEEKLNGLKTTPEDFKTLIIDAFGSENSDTKALEEANEGSKNKIVRFFVAGLSIAYNIFKEYRKKGLMREANEAYSAIANRFVESVRVLSQGKVDLKGYMNEYDNRLYYLIVNFGENLVAGTTRLHDDTLGNDREKEEQDAGLTAKNVFGDKQDLFMSEAKLKEKNALEGVKGRFFKTTEIMKMFSVFDVITGVAMSNTCAEKLCRIEAFDSLVGYKREGLDQKGMFTTFRFKLKQYIDKSENVILILDDVVSTDVSIGTGESAEERAERMKKSAEKEGKGSEGEKTAEGKKQAAPMEIPSFVVAGDMKNNIESLVKKDNGYAELKKKFIPESESEGVKKALEPSFARALLFALSLCNDTERDQFIAGSDAIQILEKYYPDAVKTKEPPKEEPPKETTDSKDSNPQTVSSDKPEPVSTSEMTGGSGTQQKQPEKMLNLMVKKPEDMFITRDPKVAITDISTYAGKLSLWFGNVFAVSQKNKEFKYLDKDRQLNLEKPDEKGSYDMITPLTQYKPRST